MTAEKHGSSSNKHPVDLHFLRRGMVVSIKHPLVFEPVATVLQKVEEESIFFRVPESFLKCNVLRGSQLVFQLFREDFEYVFYGTITEIEIQYPRMADVYIERVEKFKNIRKEKRYVVNVPANIHIPSLQKKVYAVIKNVSRGGISAVFKEKINTQVLVNVTVAASISKTELIVFEAKVLRVCSREDFNEYGMEITKIDDINKDAWDKLIYSLGENEKLFVAECLK